MLLYYKNINNQLQHLLQISSSHHPKATIVQSLEIGKYPPKYSNIDWPGPIIIWLPSITKVKEGETILSNILTPLVGGWAFVSKYWISPSGIGWGIIDVLAELNKLLIIHCEKLEFK